VFVWLSVWTEVQIVCIWSSRCHCIPKPYHLLPHLYPNWFYLSGTVPAYPGCPGKEAVKRVVFLVIIFKFRPTDYVVVTVHKCIHVSYMLLINSVTLASLASVQHQQHWQKARLISLPQGGHGMSAPAVFCSSATREFFAAHSRSCSKLEEINH